LHRALLIDQVAMSFQDLPSQPPIYPAEAESYGTSALERSQAVQARSTGTFDVPYGSDYWQKIDIYRPPGPVRSGLPVFMFAHGGAWTHGYKEWCGLMAPAIVEAPAVFVSVSYRLAPHHRYPVPLDDCLAALAYVHAHIEEHGGDPTNIHVGGHSAGGHLYALAALRKDCLAAIGLPEDVIKACYPVSSQLDLVFENPAPGSGEARIYEMFLADPADAAEASPVRLVAGNTTPFFMAYGGNDFPRIARSNVQMGEALAREPCAFHLEMLPGRGHFEMALELGDRSQAWVQRLVSWVRDGPLKQGSAIQPR
jgi:arylformamidase